MKTSKKLLKDTKEDENMVCDDGLKDIVEITISPGMISRFNDIPINSSMAFL